MDSFNERGTDEMWVKLEDDIFTHPKILAAGAPASFMFIASLCWSKHNRTAGAIPEYALRVLASNIDVSESQARELADRLCGVRGPGSEAGLWEMTLEGWAIHDWGYWQAPEDDRRVRTAMAARKANARRRALTPDKAGNYSSQSVTCDDVSRLELEEELDRDTPPIVPPKGGERVFEKDFDEAWALYPRKLSRKAALRAYTATRRRGNSADSLLAATRGFAKAMADEGREWRLIKHGSTFFGPDEPWSDYLPGGPGLTSGRKESMLDQVAASRAAYQAEMERLREPRAG